ncbi:Cys-Gly metallodipeptidase DUG1 [Lucilia cuprina]|nr:Cys-Gly metallodipeptidase DUG1 [Lucilia cuprina]
MSQLVTPQGEILIDGIKDMVAPLTNEEDKLYDDIHFSLEELEQNVGSKTVVQDNIKAALQARWRYPSLSLHGIEGAFSEAGAKTVIPAKEPEVEKMEQEPVEAAEPDVDMGLPDQSVNETIYQDVNETMSENLPSIPAVLKVNRTTEPSGPPEKRMKLASIEESAESTHQSTEPQMDEDEDEDEDDDGLIIPTLTMDSD